MYISLVMTILYSVLLFLVLSIHIPVYFFRLRILRNEKLFMLERMGLRVSKRNSGECSLWIHAVSVGEVLSLRNLICQIKLRHPDWIIHLSTLTNSGYRMAKEKLEGVDNLFFAPFDFAVVVRRFFRAYRPRVFILAESEFWPHLIREAGQHTRGVIVINGRISDRSYRRFKRIPSIIKRIIRPVHYFLVQTGRDRQRLLNIGVEDRRIQVAGNLKAEVKLPEMNTDKVKALKASLNLMPADRVVLAGSTHRGEEEMLLKAFAQILPGRPDLRFILAPRHPERVDELEKTAQTLEIPFIRKTRAQSSREWKVLIVDTFGELGRLYAVCDSAFIGGSLVPHGGQNLLEPAFYGKPVYFGPHMSNFAHLARIFVSSGAAKILKTEKDLRDFFQTDEGSLRKQGETARRILDSLQGATHETCKVIERYMSS